ncbi:MAG: hypothetical protein QOG28_4071 [Trebonia sp.]|jgi:hypothetical protein|nr:hypothetical protein [Trebonia sp.]
MTAEDAMASLTEHWDDVISRLDAARGQELRNLIAEVGGAGHTGALIRITQLLVRELPPGHPVRRALAKGYLYTSAQPDWPTLRKDLLAAGGAAQALAAGPDSGPDSGPDFTPEESNGDDDTPEDILAEVADRLLSAPALTEEEVRLRGADPADPALIRLDRPDGGQQWPRFQFAGDSGPPPIVRTVNTMLGAETDPLGVADWWLGVNAWLDGRPSDLIGDVPDELLLRAARAVTEEV